MYLPHWHQTHNNFSKKSAIGSTVKDASKNKVFPVFAVPRE